jgi:hypothetical protein
MGSLLPFYPLPMSPCQRERLGQDDANAMEIQAGGKGSVLKKLPSDVVGVDLWCI